MRVRPIASAVLAVLVAAALSCVPTEDRASNRAPSGDLVVRGGTLVPATGAGAVDDAVVVVEDGRVTYAGPADGEFAVPEGARELDAGDRWIVPGLVDAHAHYSQTGWFDGRPDAADVRSEYPYAGTIRELQSDPERFFRAYLCSGVTATFDVGGYPFTRLLQVRGETDPHAPHVEATGALLSTVDHWLNLPDQRQFIHMADEETVRSAVGAHARLGSSAIKVWYITPPQPPDSARAARLVRVAAQDAERHGLPLVVHATGLWEAKDALRAGARVLVHSVFDEPVDEEFLRLARQEGAFYVPTLTVLEGYANAYREKRVEELPYPDGCVDPATREKLARGVADSLLPTAFRSGDGPPGTPRLDRAVQNLRRVHEAGIAVATGTDAGNPGTLHGPSIHREMELMARAGMSPGEVLASTTRRAAAAMGRAHDLGTLEPGKQGDLVILGRDPLADVRNLRSVLHVVKAGRVVWSHENPP